MLDIVDAVSSLTDNSGKKRENPLGERQQSDHPSLHFFPFISHSASWFTSRKPIVIPHQCWQHATFPMYIHWESYTHTHRNTNPFLITYISLIITCRLLSKNFLKRNKRKRASTGFYLHSPIYIHTDVKRARDCVHAYRHIITFFCVWCFHCLFVSLLFLLIERVLTAGRAKKYDLLPDYRSFPSNSACSAITKLVSSLGFFPSPSLSGSIVSSLFIQMSLHPNDGSVFDKHVLIISK